MHGEKGIKYLEAQDRLMSNMEDSVDHPRSIDLGNGSAPQCQLPSAAATGIAPDFPVSIQEDSKISYLSFFAFFRP